MDVYVSGSCPIAVLGIGNTQIKPLIEFCCTVGNNHQHQVAGDIQSSSSAARVSVSYVNELNEIEVRSIFKTFMSA
jgi:hypothetical protein